MYNFVMTSSVAKSSGYNSRAKRIATTISSQIQAGKYPAGGMLPTESKLAEMHRVTRMTIRRSLQMLSDEGQVVRIPKRGTVVTETANTFPVRSVFRTKQKLSLLVIGCAPMVYGVTTRLRGIKQYAQAHQLRFATCISSRHEEALHALERIDNYDADGVVVLSPLNDERYSDVLGRLLKKNVPLVSNIHCGDLPLSTVMSDDRQGAYEAALYLIETYHRPVYFLGEMEGHEVSPERREGYAAAMRDAGFAGQIHDHIHRLEMHDFTSFWRNEEYWKPGYLQARTLFERISFPASLLCLTDFAAQGVYKAAEERKLVVGKDVFVVGFDDYPLAKFLNPALTTVRNSAVELGVETGKLLHRLATGRANAPVHIRLPMELVIRKSA